MREPAVKILQILQYACVGCGLLFVSVVTFARLDGEIGRQEAVSSFMSPDFAPDQSLWSEKRVRDFKASLALDAGQPQAVLRIPALGLEVPVYATASDLHLNRGAGYIEGMGQPDSGGNVGIAGHRDGFFRVLKDVSPGQIIEVQTRKRTHRYRVDSIEVVDSSDVKPLVDTLDPTVTLVTCFPFYFVGHAPQRFIVRGTYVWS
jgi:LPXTG-site transpeptidase (sortase) family protein